MSEEAMQRIRRLLDEVRADPDRNRKDGLEQLIAFARDESTQHGAVQGMLDLCKECMLGPEYLAPHSETILQLWMGLLERVTKVQPESAKIESLLESEYEDLSIEAEWFLDLLGYVPGEEITGGTRLALQLNDPCLRLFALLSLIRRAAQVSHEEMESVAASYLVRERLWTELMTMGKQSLMPQRWSEPEKLAESALARWLSHPNELNAPPEQIELMQEFPVELDNDQLVNAFLFRFREFPKPWEPGEGWMAGVAGPYWQGEAVSSPWSAFKRWDLISPEEHFEMLFHRDSACEVE